jgi:hypothetical protein
LLRYLSTHCVAISNRRLVAADDAGIAFAGRTIASTTQAAGRPCGSIRTSSFMRATARRSIEEEHAMSHSTWVGKSGHHHYERMLQSEDFNEGAIAFSEKRSSNFKDI